MLLLHYFDLLRICCTTCSYSCAAVDEISTEIWATRGLSAVAEFLVHYLLFKNTIECNGYSSRLAIRRLRVRLAAIPLFGNSLRQVVHSRVPLSPSSIIWYRSKGGVMSCGWEGNRRSGVSLAMRHRLQWFIHLRGHRIRKKDEHPAYTLQGYGTLYLFYLSKHKNVKKNSKSGAWVGARWATSSTTLPPTIPVEQSFCQLNVHT